TSNMDDAFVVTRTGKLLGLVTMERLVEVIRGKGNSIREALELDLPTCTADTLVEDLFPLAASTRYPIPVLDERGRFTGEVHTSSILVSMIQEKEVETDARVP
ncbi:unnamed protein product, partial [marine sediment metagenome]